jgi:uncharacterized protein
VSACGSHRTEIAGVGAALRPSGALWLEDARTLVVADLHFEKGSAFAARGQMLPPYDTAETLRRLAAEVAATSPRVLIFLGDTLHDGKAEARIAREDEAALHAIAHGRNLVWIVGNHDADGPSRLPGDVATEVAIGRLTLRHEPRRGADHGWAAGHLHPCARVAGKGGSVRRRCFITDGARIVLPAFGAFTGSLNVRNGAFAGLFATAPLAVVLGAGKSHPVAWRRLVGD